METTAFGAIFSDFPWNSFLVHPWNFRTESLSEPEVLSDHPVEDIAVTEGNGLEADGDVTYGGDTYMRDAVPDQSKPYPGSEFKDSYAETQPSMPIDSVSSVDVPIVSEKPEVQPVIVGRAVLNDENCNGQFDCREFFYLDRNSSGAWEGHHDDRLEVGFPCMSESKPEPDPKSEPEPVPESESEPDPESEPEPGPEPAPEAAPAVEPEEPGVETFVFALPRSLIPLSDLAFFKTSPGSSEYWDRHGHSHRANGPTHSHGRSSSVSPPLPDSGVSDRHSDFDVRHHRGDIAAALAAHHHFDSCHCSDSDLDRSPAPMTWQLAGATEDGYDIPVEFIEATEYDAMSHEFLLDF